MTSHNRIRLRSATVAFAAAAASISISIAGTAHAQQPPSPFDLSSQLDLECRPATGQPPAPTVGLRQLNPVLVDQIPNQLATLGELRQVCVPVAKDHATPSPAALAFIEWYDIACYRASADPIDVSLKLSHLNPVLVGLPDEFVTLTGLADVCVPVRKNASPIPAPVLNMVKYMDQACYKLEQPTSDANRVLWLSHLNPVIVPYGFDDRLVRMRRAHKLCVPVAKNDEVIPPGVRDEIKYVDFLVYPVDHLAGVVPPLPLSLTHLNPIYAGLPAFPVVLGNDPLHLMVPVAKNDHIPPKVVVGAN